MKKLILLCAAVATFGVAFGQSKEAEAVKKKLEKNALATQDAKKGATVGPWLEKANILIDASNTYTSKLIPGFAIEQTLQLLGQPNAQSSVEFKGSKYTKYVYDNFNLYANESNLIAFWEVTGSVEDNALNDAYDALVKAKSISPKDFLGTSKGVTVADRLKAQLQTEGMAKYSMGNSLEAAKDFVLSFETAQLTGAFDTIYLYYAGVAYSEVGDNAKAAPIFEKLLSAGSDQDGMVQYYLSLCFMANNEPLKAIEVLEKGFKKYPSNNTLIASLINAYISSKQDPAKIVAIVQQAQQLDPKNVSLYLVESSVYNEIGDRENSYKALEKAQQLDPTYFGAFFNYGVMKILEAEDVRKESDKIDINDTKSYDAAMMKIVQLQKDAVDTLEKAHELDSKNFDVVDLLRQLYFPLRDEQPAKYEKFDQLSKELAPAK